MQGLVINCQTGEQTIIEVPDIPVDLNMLKIDKIQKIRELCNNEVLAGFYSSAKGTEEFYGLDYEDQINLEAYKNNVKLGLIVDGTLEYYAKGKPCEIWSNAEIVKLYEDAMAFKISKVKRCKALIDQIQNAINEEEINNINW